MEKGKCLKLTPLVLSLVALITLALPISVKADDSYKTYELQQAYFDQQAEYQWSSQLTTYSQTLVGKRTGQCVLAIRNYFGVPRSEVQGLAKNTKTNSKTPKIGAVIVLRMSWAGHVGLVINKNQDTVTYFDSNGNWTQRGAIRTISINDQRIVGYRIIQ